MFGPGYILSWDLVTWLSEHRDELQGFIYDAEDHAISEMLKWGGKAEESWITAGPEEYAWDRVPEAGEDWVRGYNFGPETILVHSLKSDHQLGEVIQFFLGDESITEGQSQTSETIEVWPPLYTD
jgi:hypothetical protein